MPPFLHRCTPRWIVRGGVTLGWIFGLGWILSCDYIYRPRPPERGFGIWIYINFGFFQVGVHFVDIIGYKWVWLTKWGRLLAGNKKPHHLRRGLVFLLRRVQDLNLRRIVIPWRISNTQSHNEEYWICAINVLCFLDYWFYKLVEYGFRKGQPNYLLLRYMLTGLGRKNWRGGFRVYSCFFRLLLCYFVRYFPTFFFNNFWLLVLILCKSFLCLSRANVDGKFLNDFGGSLQLEQCSRFNPYDGIPWCFISFLSIVENSQVCWQILQ